MATVNPDVDISTLTETEPIPAEGSTTQPPSDYENPYGQFLYDFFRDFEPAITVILQTMLRAADYDEDDLTYPHSPTTVIRFALFANLIASFPSLIVTPFPFSCKIIRFRFLVLGLYDFRLFGFDISLFCDLAC